MALEIHPLRLADVQLDTCLMVWQLTPGTPVDAGHAPVARSQTDRWFMDRDGDRPVRSVCHRAPGGAVDKWAR